MLAIHEWRRQAGCPAHGQGQLGSTWAGGEQGPGGGQRVASGQRGGGGKRETSSGLPPTPSAHREMAPEGDQRSQADLKVLGSSRLSGHSERGDALLLSCPPPPHGQLSST